jgi:hypothetical protein
MAARALLCVSQASLQLLQPEPTKRSARCSALCMSQPSALPCWRSYSACTIFSSYPRACTSSQHEPAYQQRCHRHAACRILTAPIACCRCKAPRLCAADATSAGPTSRRVAGKQFKLELAQGHANLPPSGQLSQDGMLRPRLPPSEQVRQLQGVWHCL